MPPSVLNADPEVPALAKTLAEEWVLMAKSEALEKLGEQNQAEQLAYRLMREYVGWESWRGSGHVQSLRAELTLSWARSISHTMACSWAHVNLRRWARSANSWLGAFAGVRMAARSSARPRLPQVRGAERKR